MAEGSLNHHPYAQLQPQAQSLVPLRQDRIVPALGSRPLGREDSACRTGLLGQPPFGICAYRCALSDSPATVCSRTIAVVMLISLPFYHPLVLPVLAPSLAPRSLQVHCL